MKEESDLAQLMAGLHAIIQDQQHSYQIAYHGQDNDHLDTAKIDFQKASDPSEHTGKLKAALFNQKENLYRVDTEMHKAPPGTSQN
jgi:hypothetical protein